MTDDLSVRLGSLAGEHAALEDRLSLERPLASSPPGLTGAPVAATSDFDAHFERMVSDHRNFELIIFGISKMQPENCADTLSRVTASLGVAMSSSEVARAFRIKGRDWSSSPLMAKLTTIVIS